MKINRSKLLNTLTILVTCNLFVFEAQAKSNKINAKPIQVNTKNKKTIKANTSNNLTKAPVAPIQAQPAAAPQRKSNISENSKAWENFQNLRRKYRAGEIGDEGMWAALMEISDDIKTMPKSQQSIVLQTQANLMSTAKQPILAAVYAAQAIRDASNPLDDDFKKSWQILREVSKLYPIQNLLEIVASSIDIQDKQAPVFGTDWNYFLANSLMKENKLSLALETFQKLKLGDRYFLPGKFQEAMILTDNKDIVGAVKSLLIIINSNPKSEKNLTRDELANMIDHANMALGRLYYENRQFGDAIKHYRLVRREGSQFYDSLFEQSWALFMAGYPNHALGMLYGVRSPFFKDTFNPEATMLASIIYYWMCRYDDSKAELADFMTNHQKSIDALDAYLAKGITGNRAYYQLFEDAIAGVSTDSLGLPKEIVSMAIQQDNMLLVRDQYAAVVREMQKLEAKGIYGSKARLESPRTFLNNWAEVLKDDIGLRLGKELKAMKSDYERLYDQGQFLYVELLMSKKDQLLGKELHSEGKIDKVSQLDNIRGWGKKTQSWASDDKQEYWADELGFHIYRIEPMCVSKN